MAKETQSCSWTGCGRTSKARLGERVLCLEHFLELTGRQMKLLQHALTERGGDRSAMPGAQEFLSQLIWQTTLLATEVRLLHPDLREELVSLSKVAADLYKRVSRAPRIPRRIHCVLRSGLVAAEIPEPCVTVNISLRGACVEGKMPPRGAQTLLLERSDNGKCARVRVVWSDESETGRHLAGLEILDQEDYWGLAVSQAKPSASDQAEET